MTITTCLKSYYKNRALGYFFSFIYILNQIALTLYLMFIPIKVAFFWLLRSPENAEIQTNIDITVLILFTVHIYLYFHENFQLLLHNPYASWAKELITVELVYDIATFFLAVYAVLNVNHSLAERIVELVFFFKIYKLIKFDLKCTYITIGTVWYPIYKVLRTLLIVFMVIAYIGSIFYAIDYNQYHYQTYQFEQLLWIVNTPAISECVTRPFIIQLEYSVYWALGTASTAAYGDISAADPPDVLFNILCLAFEGFIFGFYLNSMHSIPMQSKKKQTDLLQKFDAFQQHSSNRKLDKKLYLQILCSLQYTQLQEHSLESLAKIMPKKYITEIKYYMYQNFIQNQYYFRNKQLQQKVVTLVKETICQLDEDVYMYQNIGREDLLYIKEGNIQYALEGETKDISVELCNEGSYFGMYSFLTGVRVKEQAICKNYCMVYGLSRADYKSQLSPKEKLQFYNRSMRALYLQGPQLVCQPIINYYMVLQLNNSHTALLSPANSDLQKRSSLLSRILSGLHQPRQPYRRTYKTGKKFIQHPKRRSIATQTQESFQSCTDIVSMDYY